ncbi:MAG TPA: type VII secretion protein EccE [Stackebrandtia sp.]|uniref:type VII secretion protein EccE n=1 Tax=Stackebrandtia sp. TaxID=2023065 RepID=UPI002D5D6C3E|nr:type VII secretion protein EccE [Stackebrandtia sp.]HZE40903.1 type VII secretion protein EccE [Stackebrandtia sp.]
MACEILAAGAFLAWMAPRPVAYGAIGVAAVGILAVLLSGTRGIDRRVLLRLRRGRLRKRVAASRVAGDALAVLAPRLQIVSVTERDKEFGVAFDGQGWFAGIALETDDPAAPAGLGAATVSSVAQVLADAPGNVTGIQIVSHMVPTPSVELDPDAACIESYRELLGNDPVVSHHATWLAIRLDVDAALPVSEERGGGVEGARRAVTSVAGRLLRRLADAGVTFRVLGADGLRVALTHSISGETISAALAQQAVEEWKAWRLGSLAHVTFGMDGRIRDINAMRRLWTAMAMVSSSFSTVSVTLRPWRRSETGVSLVTMNSLLRVAYDDDVDDGVADELVGAARECGVRLWRFDGEQAAATYASAPTGGGFGGR